MKISNIKKLKDLNNLTIKNNKLRKSLYRSTNLEFVLMSIPVDKDIPLEVHKTEDQFIRIEEGECKIVIGKTDKKTSYLKKNENNKKINKCLFSIFIYKNLKISLNFY